MCLVLYMTIESWLSERSTSDTRGTFCLLMFCYQHESMTMVGKQNAQFFRSLLGQTLFIVIFGLIVLATYPCVFDDGAGACANSQCLRIDLRKVWDPVPQWGRLSIANGACDCAFWSPTVLSMP